MFDLKISELKIKKFFNTQFRLNSTHECSLLLNVEQCQILLIFDVCVLLLNIKLFDVETEYLSAIRTFNTMRKNKFIFYFSVNVALDKMIS